VLGVIPSADNVIGRGDLVDGVRRRPRRALDAISGVGGERAVRHARA